MRKTVFLLTILLCSSVIISGCGKKTPPAQTQGASSEQKAPASAQKPVIKKVVSQVEDKEEGTPFTQITVQNWDASKEVKKVEDSGENVRVKDAQAADLPKTESTVKTSKSPAGTVKKAPTKSLASRLTPADNSKVIYWQPKWRQKGIGGAWISSVALSDDRSVLCVLETTGKDEGPFGSRIIVINTYDWTVIAVYEYDDKYYTSIEFAGTSDDIIALAARQPVMKQPCVFNLINLTSGKITEGQVLQSQPLCWKAFDATRIFASFPDSEFLSELKIGDIFISSPVKTSVNVQADCMAISTDRKTLALASKSKISFVAISNLRQFHSADLSPNQTVTGMEYGGNNLLVASLSDGSAVYIKNAAQPEDLHIKESIPLFSYFASTNTLIAGDNYMSTLYFFDCERPSGETKKAVLNGTKPPTSSFLFFAAALPGNQFILVVDKPGNIYRIWPEGKRYGKEILFSGIDSLLKK